MRVLWVYERLTARQVKLATCLALHADMSLEIMCHWQGQPPLDRSLIPLTKITCKSTLDFAARRAIRTRVKTGRYDIVSADTSRALANVLGACRGIRPQPRIIGHRRTIKRLRVLDPANWITFWHPRLSKIVCESHATQKSLERFGLRTGKTAAVWEGVSLDEEQALQRTALAEFDIPADAFVVGIVADMRPVKGVDVLLRAALQLANLPNIYWLLIGEIQDPRITELAQEPRIASRVRLPGPRGRGIRYTSLFDVYASPSRSEGMPMSIVEAMALGACPVATAVGGCSEIVRDRRDGLIVPPEDPVALAGAIRAVYDSPQRRRKLVESAQRRAKSVFSIESWAERIHAVYAEVTAGHAARAA